MKKTIKIFLLLCFNILVFGQKNSIRFYPISFAIGKFYYCSDIRFSYERKIKEQHRIEIGIQASIPNPFVIGPSLAFQTLYLEKTIIPMMGGGGFLSYKYQIPNKELYVGTKLMTTYYHSIKSTHSIYGFIYDQEHTNSEEFNTKMYMNSINFLLGWNIHEKRDLDISLEIGYRYNRAYYIFENRTEEMPHDYTNIYTFIRFPLRFGLDLSINISSINRYKRNKKTEINFNSNYK